MRIDQGQVAFWPGDKLPNHATLLAATWYESDESHMSGIVLAVTGTKPQPFVTWERTVDMSTTATGGTQQIDQCFWGHYFSDLKSALTDYAERVENRTHNKRNEKAIALRGHEDGKNAASWLVDGNTDDPYHYLDQLIAGMEEGDPEVMDKLPHPQVGGEFADDPTWEKICLDEIERYEDGEDELFDVYTRSFHEGVEAGIREMHAHFAAVLDA